MNKNRGFVSLILPILASLALACSYETASAQEFPKFSQKFEDRSVTTVNKDDPKDGGGDMGGGGASDGAGGGSQFEDTGGGGDDDGGDMGGGGASDGAGGGGVKIEYPDLQVLLKNFPYPEVFEQLGLQLGLDSRQKSGSHRSAEVVSSIPIADIYRMLIPRKGCSDFVFHSQVTSGKNPIDVFYSQREFETGNPHPLFRFEEGDYLDLDREDQVENRTWLSYDMALFENQPLVNGTLFKRGTSIAAILGGRLLLKRGTSTDNRLHCLYERASAKELKLRTYSIKIPVELDGAQGQFSGEFTVAPLEDFGEYRSQVRGFNWGIKSPNANPIKGGSDSASGQIQYEVREGIGFTMVPVQDDSLALLGGISHGNHQDWIAIQVQSKKPVKVKGEETQLRMTVVCTDSLEQCEIEPGSGFYLDPRDSNPRLPLGVALGK